MAYFSQRYQHVPEKDIQVDDIDIELFNRLWNLFYSREYQFERWIFSKGELEAPELILDSFGCTYVFPSNYSERNENIGSLRKFLMNSEWYIIYDFIEKYVELTEPITQRKELEKEINVILEQEKSGYRMIRGIITPITNQAELDSIKKSMSTKFISVNTHFEKALKLYSNRKKPDYENSIKESISAVEAICCIINEKDTTLNKAIEKLKAKGVRIHPAMEKAFISLYGYTSDESGIRHGGIDFANAPAEDAKYMLVSCSAFVNYLIEKWSKVSE